LDNADESTEASNSGKVTITVRDIRDYGYNSASKQHTVLVKVDRKSKQRLKGHSRIWVPVTQIAEKSAYLMNFCLDKIWAEVKSSKWRKRFIYLSIGASAKQGTRRARRRRAGRGVKANPALDTPGET
jgi:hypothetical protein